MATGDEKRRTVGASLSDALERVRRVEVPASSLSDVGLPKGEADGVEGCTGRENSATKLRGRF
jgi:hypothetical protein